MCLKKKAKKVVELGCYQCKLCGAVSLKKKKICKPQKVKHCPAAVGRC